MNAVFSSLKLLFCMISMFSSHFIMNINFSYADTLVRISVVREFNLGPQIASEQYSFSISEGMLLGADVFQVPVCILILFH